MSLLTHSIGEFNFLTLAQETDPPSETCEIDQRAGVAGTQITRNAVKGKPFIVNSRVDCATYADAHSLFTQYQDLIGQDAVSLVQGSIVGESMGFLVNVLDVKKIRSPALAGGIGGFNANPRALLECRWTLIAVDT